MLSTRVFLVAAVAFLLSPAESARADCCAGGHVSFLVHGSQFGYGGGTARGRSAQPFAGVANPRYAATHAIGGPMSGAGPSYQFARRLFVNTPQLEALAAAAAADRQAQYASDATLMEQPADDSEAYAPDPMHDNFTPEYPGQGYGQLGAEGTVVDRQSANRDRGAQATTARAPSRRRVARAPSQTRSAAGAYASDSASRIARHLRVSGLEF